MKKFLIAGMYFCLGMFGVFSIYLAFFHLMNYQDPRFSLMNDNIRRSRMPAQSEPLGNDYDLRIFQDYFSAIINDGPVKYQMDLDFRAKGDHEYLLKRCKKAASEAFGNIFTQMSLDKKVDPSNGEGRIESSLMSVAKDELIDSFIDEFVKTLMFYKLVDLEVQIDIKFTPTIDDNNSFSKELSSNHLVNLSNTGNLLEDIAGKTPRLIDSVLSTSTVNLKNDQRYQYNGGAVTIWLQILDPSEIIKNGLKDMDILKNFFNELFNLGNPRMVNKGFMLGFVRYRRYFKDNLNSIQEFKHKLGNVSFEQISGTTKGKGRFLTVDILKKFSTKKIKPSLSSLIIYPGKLIEPEEEKDDFLEKLFSSPEMHKTDNLYVLGKIKHDKANYTFKTELQKLMYDFNKKKFDLYHTKTFTHFPKFFGSSTDDLNMSGKIRSALFTELGANLIEELNLSRFHKNIGGGR